MVSQTAQGLVHRRALLLYRHHIIAENNKSQEENVRNTKARAAAADDELNATSEQGFEALDTLLQQLQQSPTVKLPIKQKSLRARSDSETVFRTQASQAEEPYITFTGALVVPENANAPGLSGSQRDHASKKGDSLNASDESADLLDVDTP